MSTALVSNTTMSPGRLEPRAASSLPSVPWRDPHDIAPGELAAYIAHLERACVENPRSADLRTCLGILRNFWAQLKYAELHYRLRILDKAEEETRRAADLAASPL